MKVYKLFLILALSLLFLVGCAADGTDSDDRQLAAVSSEATDDPDSPTLPSSFSLPILSGVTLDPLTCPEGVQQTAGALLYEGLYELDAQFEPQPRLCTASSYDPETLTWTFTIRSGVLFSDGSPFTAADAAASIKRACGTERYRARLAAVQSVAAGEGSLSIVLTRADTGFPALLDVPIVKSGTESDPVPTGTGPYRYELQDGKACLTANANWWNGSGQPTGQITLVACEKENAVRYQFTSHAVQLITCDLTGVNPLSATGSFEFHDADAAVFQYVGFNMSRPIFSNSAVRRALSQGVDRSTIVSAYLSGHATAAQFPVSPASALYPSDLETEYSPSAYLSAAQAAGLDSQSLSLIVNSENSFKVSAAEYVAASLSAAGISVTVKALPWDEFLAALSAGDYDLYYGETKLPASWNLQALLGTGGALNYGGYSDATMNLLLNQYASASDRSAAMYALCRYFNGQAPVIPICFKRVSVLSQKDVVEGLAPTEANPFFDLSACSIQLAK